MTRDEEVLQQFQDKTNVLLGKAQQFLTTALPGGPGAFVYVVMSNLVGKLFGHTRQYVEKAVNRPITLPDFIYVEPLDEELEEFFANERFKSLRAEFPADSEDFSDNDWATLRRYYMPLYYTLTVKEPVVCEMFASEIQSQNYKRIISDFSLFPMYKKALQSVPTASKQNALWNSVTSIMNATVKDVWNKAYAKQLFEDARKDPEVTNLIDRIKTKVGEKVDLQKLSGLRDTIQYVAGRSMTREGQEIGISPLRAVEFVTEVLPGGKLTISNEVLRKLHLGVGAQARVILLCEE